jgi:hypothetical protein
LHRMSSWPNPFRLSTCCFVTATPHRGQAKIRSRWTVWGAALRPRWSDTKSSSWRRVASVAPSSKQSVSSPLPSWSSRRWRPHVPPAVASKATAFFHISRLWKMRLRDSRTTRVA